MLLETRLAAWPGFIVLERRHAWPLGLERSPSSDVPALRQGAGWVDGTLSFSQERADYRRPRLRKPGAEPGEIVVPGKKSDLPRLVEDLAEAVTKSDGHRRGRAKLGCPRGSLGVPARGPLGLAVQGDDAALESLDSAELLGEKAADLFALRIEILRRRADASGNLKRTPSASATETMIDDTQPPRDAAYYEKEKLEPRIDLLTFNWHPIVRT